MTKRIGFVAAVCGLALVGAGCGDDDNDTLSYDETGTEIGQICDSVDLDGLNGKPGNDAPILERGARQFEDAIQELRDLEVNEELESTRDQFADNADQQLAILQEAQAAAEAGDAKEYRATLQEGEPLSKESDELASQLGATACIED